jgi:hypothetical protein
MRLIQIAASFFATVVTLDSYFYQGVSTRAALLNVNRTAQHFNEKIEHMTHPLLPRQ